MEKGGERLTNSKGNLFLDDHVPCQNNKEAIAVNSPMAF